MLGGVDHPPPESVALGEHGEHLAEALTAIVGDEPARGVGGRGASPRGERVLAVSVSPMAEGPGSTATIDGRSARRERNRDAVLDAVIDMFTEGSLTPGPAEVAVRSGVSIRSVHRYFEDTDNMIRAAMDRSRMRMAPLFALHALGDGPLHERIARMVSGRVALQEQAGPLYRAAAVRARRHDLFRERVHETRTTLRVQVEAMFAPELATLDRAAAREIAAALDVLLGFDALDHLRRERGFSPAATERTTARAVAAVLAAAARAGTNGESEGVR